MRTALRIGLAAVAVGLAGCGGGGTPATPLSVPPLAVADWQKLPAVQKYTAETFDRLKAADPALQTAEGWDRFEKTVIAPARKKDFPNGQPR